jgi:hypothetical protein
MDVWGNVDATPYSASILLDTTPPTNGTVTATRGNAQVALSWSGFNDTGSGIGGYKVVYGAGGIPYSCSAGTVLYTGTDTTYLQTGLTNGTTYGYRVCAIDNAGNMSTGATASAKPVPETIPPTGSITINGGAAATGSSSVSLALAATADWPGAIQMCISNTTTCTAWTALAATKIWTLPRGDGTKTVYAWFMDVWGNVDATPYSASILLDTTPPTNGTVTATPGNAQVALSWSGFNDTGSGIGGYKVVYGAGGIPYSCSAGTAIYTGTGTTYLQTGLTNGTTYGYRVCAIDNAGNMSAGATASAKPVPETVPPTGSITINGGAAATGSSSVSLALAATADWPGAIQMCISNTTTCTAWTALAATKSWTLPTGDGTKTVYAWFMDVWGNVDATPYSASILLDTTPPTNGTVTATPGNAQVALSWSGFNDAGSGIGGYKVVYGAGGVPYSCSAGTVLYTGTATTYLQTGLTNGTTYGYRVCAIDNVGNMSTGATASAKPVPETIPPTGSITINGGAAATGSPVVSMALAATADWPGAIQMCISNTTTCTAWTALAATKSWTLPTGDGTKTVYAWFMDVWGNVDATPYSASILLDTTPPTNGTVTATPGNEEVTLSWSGFNDSGSGIGGYKVVYAVGSIPTSCSAGTAIYTNGTTYLQTGLTNGTTYGFRVCAIDNVGNMSTGAIVIGTPVNN